MTENHLPAAIQNFIEATNFELRDGRIASLRIS
jgi:hypothetical protein